MSHRLAIPSSLPRLVKAALVSCLIGGLASVAGCQWLLWDHDDGLQFCDEVYEDCMANAGNEQEKQWCADEARYCYETCEAGWDEDEDEGGAGGPDESPADEGGPDDGAADEGGADEGGADEGGADEGGADEGGADEGEGEDPGVCIALFGNCLDSAQTLDDVEACEVLFDQCVNPGECPSCGGCPAEALDACLSSYASCAALAHTPEQVAECAATFDQCTAPFAAECEVDENPQLQPCLDQHELCVACAHDEPQLEACQVVFDTCLAS